MPSIITRSSKSKFCKGHEADSRAYLSPILNRGFLVALVAALALRASPSFSVTTHSLTRPASSSPIKVALVRCRDITFSKRIQNIIKWSDLKVRNIIQTIQFQFRFFDNHGILGLCNNEEAKPWGSNGIKNGNNRRDINSSPFGNLNFRDQNSCRQHHAVKHKGHNVSYKLPHYKEAVNHMRLLPQRHFLHQ